MPLYCLVDIFLEWTVPDGGDFTQRVAHFAVPELLHHIWYMVLKNPLQSHEIFTGGFLLTESHIGKLPQAWWLLQVDGLKMGGELSPVNLTVCELETMAVDGWFT